jgi:hypothetical protein
MRVWKQVALLASWFVLMGIGFLIRDIIILPGRDVSWGGPMGALAIGFATLELSRRRLEVESGEDRPLWLHVAPTLVVALPLSAGTVWWASVQGGLL